MAYKQQQAVSKPLLIILVVVALIGAFLLARNMMSGSPEDEVPAGVPPVPEDLKPPPPDPYGRGPTGGS
jgi:hypothetical protein